jgi:hypothetical protein
VGSLISGLKLNPIKEEKIHGYELLPGMYVIGMSDSKYFNNDTKPDWRKIKNYKRGFYIVRWKFQKNEGLVIQEFEKGKLVDRPLYFTTDKPVFLDTFTSISYSDIENIFEGDLFE